MSSRSLVKETLRKSNLITCSYGFIEDKFRALLYDISPVLLAKYRYIKKMGRLPDLNNPRTFDEKLLWLMLYWRHPLKTKCADKHAVRRYVEKHGLGHVLPELLGVYEKSSDIEFDVFPERFVLKCTHGCGYNIICKDKTLLDRGETKRKLDQWMSIDISKLGGEIHYASIKPMIICEKFLDDLSGNQPSDYKVYCFDGKAHCTMACTDRDSGYTKFDFYDREWKEMLPYSISSLRANRSIPKPEAYEEIIKAAEILSESFPFVRVDFYSIKGNAVFGEMTFTPNGCIDPGLTDIAQREMGDKITLPDKYLDHQ